MQIEILYDGQREMRETFTVHMKPDDNMVAEIQVTQRPHSKYTLTNINLQCYISTHMSMRTSASVKIARQQLALLSARLNHSLIKSFSLWSEMLRGMSRRGQTADTPNNSSGTFYPLS